MQHQFKEGKKHWEIHIGYCREDVCKLCGLLRSVVYWKDRETGEEMEDVAHFVRSTQIFGSNEMPPCWGAKNPQ